MDLAPKCAKDCVWTTYGPEQVACNCPNVNYVEQGEFDEDYDGIRWIVNGKTFDLIPEDDTGVWTEVQPQMQNLMMYYGNPQTKEMPYVYHGNRQSKTQSIILLL